MTLAPTIRQTVAISDGDASAVNITAAMVLKTSPGRSYRVSVIVAGTAAGTLNDCAATADAASGNQVGTIPTTVGTYQFNWPHKTGIVLVPGTGQTLAISYS